MEDVLKEMLDRATDPRTPDDVKKVAAAETFRLVLRQNSHLVLKAKEMIFAKICSTDEMQAVKAVALLEVCMSTGSNEFQNEIAKKRTLNALTSLVLNIDKEHQITVATKKRILQCLQIWTLNFPQKDDIRIVYENLSKKFETELGRVDASTLPKRQNKLDIDEKQLTKLIKSNNRDDLELANLLIQESVLQESLRTKLRVEHKNRLREVENTVAVLNEMLDTCQVDLFRSSDVNDTVRDLYVMCEKYIKLEFPDCGDTEIQTEITGMKSSLKEVMLRYQRDFPQPRAQQSNTNQRTIVNSNRQNNSELLSSMSNDMLLNAGDSSTEATGLATANTASRDRICNMDLTELNDIFSTEPNSQANTNTQFGKEVADLCLLEPVKLDLESEVKIEKGAQGADATENRRSMLDIDEISEQLLKSNLAGKDRFISFKKSVDKITLNDLVKGRSSVELASSPTTPVIKTDVTTASLQTESTDLEASIASDTFEHGTDSAMDEPVNTPDQNATGQHVKNDINMTITHLSELSIDLCDVAPDGTERLLLDDDDAKLSLYFTQNRPSNHVSVILLAMQNKSNLAMKDFHLEASVKKPSKVRLLAPTSTTIAPIKSFPLPTIANQLLLLLNPTGKPVDLTCIVSYKLGDDPDPIKESIVTKDIPYVE